MWKGIIIFILTSLIIIYIIKKYADKKKEDEGKFIFSFYERQHVELRNAMNALGTTWLYINEYLDTYIEKNEVLFSVTSDKIRYLNWELENVVFTGGSMIGFFGEPKTKLEVKILTNDPLELEVKRTRNGEVSIFKAREFY